jgi:epoxyqueuosine reductase
MRSSTSKTQKPSLPPREAIRARAISEGFDAVGFARAEAPAGAARALAQYLADGHHGGMDWMATTAERRADPKVLWPEAKSVIALGVNYAPAQDPLAILERRSEGAVSVYAQGADYHDVIKKRLKRLAGWIAKTYGAEVKVFVDTAPVMEKPLAHRAGLGWQGKHTNLVSREFGSWLFLGSVFTTLELEPDAAVDDHCGSCRNCLDICPTKAFPAPYRLDARRCISYLTIEHKGHIARQFRDAIGNRIYGCDDCLAVCPWNKFAQAAREAAFAPRESLRAALLSELAALDDARFREVFRGSPVKRIGRDRFVRNVLIAIGNSDDAALAGPARTLLSDASALVRAMAVWALAKLLPSEDFAKLARDFEDAESDPDVVTEWHQGTKNPNRGDTPLPPIL